MDNEHKGRVIATLIKKGGTGKSETALNLAYGLSQAGRKVLLIDMDSQTNATNLLLHKKAEQEKQKNVNKLRKMIDEKKERNEWDNNDAGFGWRILKEFLETDSMQDKDISHVLTNKCGIKDVIVETRCSNLYLAPASNNLTMTDLEMKTNPDYGQLFRGKIQDIRNEYDYIIIDEMPVENAITLCTLECCIKKKDIILYPLKVENKALSGMEAIHDRVSRIKNYLGHKGQEKILITMKNRNAVDRSYIETLREIFGDCILKTEIPYQAKPILDATQQDKILLEMDEKREFNVSQAYQQLVDEIIASE